MTQKKPNKNSFYQLAKRVLTEQKKPMHYADITKEILKIKETKGKTPERTVMAILIRDNKDVFKSMGDGVFGLTKLIDFYKQNEAQKC